MGETCVCPEVSAPKRLESPSVYDADSWWGAPLVLGVCGPPDCAGTLPMNHEGTQPRSPVSSLTACGMVYSETPNGALGKVRLTYDQWL